VLVYPGMDMFHAYLRMMVRLSTAPWLKWPRASVGGAEREPSNMLRDRDREVLTTLTPDADPPPGRVESSPSDQERQDAPAHVRGAANPGDVTRPRGRRRYRASRVRRPTQNRRVRGPPGPHAGRHRTRSRRLTEPRRHRKRRGLVGNRQGRLPNVPRGTWTGRLGSPCSVATHRARPRLRPPLGGDAVNPLTRPGSADGARARARPTEPVPGLGRRSPGLDDLELKTVRAVRAPFGEGPCDGPVGSRAGSPSSGGSGSPDAGATFPCARVGRRGRREPSGDRSVR